MACFSTSARAGFGVLAHVFAENRLLVYDDSSIRIANMNADTVKPEQVNLE